MAEQSDGALIAGTAKGLVRFRNGTWKDAGTDFEFQNKPVRQLYFDKAGQLWILTDDRVLYIPTGQKGLVDTGEPTGLAGNFAQGLDGTIWIPETGRSAHSLIVEAVERHAAYEEQIRSLVKEALVADAEIDNTGEVYRAEDVHAWMQRLAVDGRAPRPKQWHR